jgi:predicted secreted hydrolase
MHPAAPRAATRATAACAAALAAAMPVPALAPPPPARMPAMPAGTPAPGFAQALEPRAFVFPRDHGPHPEFRQEWWYLTGNLEAAGGERFGFELTFFRFALAPAPVGAAASAAPTAVQGGAAPPSAWRARQIYMAHFAVTDVAAGRFHFAQRFERDALGLAGAGGDPLRVWVDDWWLEAAAAGGDRAGSSGDAGRWQLHAAEPGYALDLTLSPESAPVPNGEAGLSRKADEPSAASYYYSVPRLAARGRLLRGGESLEVHGLAWLDREWGSGGLGRAEAGWDWFGLQFGDGSALMFYALRRRDGTRDAHSAGTWVAGSGETRSLNDTAVDIDVTDHWTSADGVHYPSGWRVRVPSLALEVAVHPVLSDQELRTRPRYWEGAVDVSGARAGRPLQGRGYVELVGYAPDR